MKKLLLLVAVAASALTANAQALEKVGKYYYHAADGEPRQQYYSKFFDNWSVGVNGGAQTPTVNHAFFKSARPSFGVELRKDFSPLFGLSAQAQAYVNGGPIANGMQPAFPRDHYKAGYTGKKAIDNVKYGLYGNLNLMNLFGGYIGRPRFFELEAKLGGGFLHTYSGKSSTGNYSNDAFYVDLGMNALFNLGEQRQWAIKVSPSIGYFVDPVHPGELNQGDLNINRSAIEVQAGVVYRFGNSYNRDHFALAKSNYVDEAALNTTINDLRNQINAKSGEIAPLQQQIRSLQQQLADLRNQAPATLTDAAGSNRAIECIVHYRLNKTVIDASQVPNVERVAMYLKKYPNATAHVTGYASVEGPASNNNRLSIGRANAVKNMLVNKYKIAASRISVEGPGTTDMYGKSLSANRVSITVVNDVEAIK